MQTIGVAIPTRNRPEKLARCLEALAGARLRIGYNVVVCDSSTTNSVRREVSRVCEKYDFVKLRFHDGKNVAAARNMCASSCDTDMIVNVDDDIYVEADAIEKLVEAYGKCSGHRVVAGSVRWGDNWSRPVVMRPIGYGRPLKAGEKPDFLVGAFFIYSRKLALAKPWNDRVRASDDRFMGALWRADDVSLLYEPAARAFHDHQNVYYGVEHQAVHIYTNLFDSLIANPNYSRAFCYEILGFIWGAKKAIISGEGLKTFFNAWSNGHRMFWRDWEYLRELVSLDLPAP